MAFRVGQKVVCVYDKGQTFPPLVKWGVVYTIASMHERRIGTCLDFAELNSAEAPAHACFPAMFFRPVVEKQADISIFTAMLKPTKVDA